MYIYLHFENVFVVFEANSCLEVRIVYEYIMSVCLKFYMSPSFTARNIAFVSWLFFIFTPLYSPLKILFSHQVLAQYREKQESYKENIILSGRVIRQQNISNRK